jgi:hypothetical protein
MTDTYGPGNASIPAWTAPTEGPPIAPAPAGARSPAAGTARTSGAGTARTSGAGTARGPAAGGANYGPPPGRATPTHRSWQPGIMPLRPATFGDFLSLPFKAIRYNRTVVVGGPLACFLVVGLATALATWMVFTDLDLNSAFAGLSSNPTGLRAETIVTLALAGVAWLLSDAFARGIVAPGVARAVLGERISLGQAWRVLRARIWPVLGLYALATAAMLVPLAIVVGLIALASQDSSGAAIIGVMIVALLLLFPLAILYSVLMGVALPLVVLERGGVMASARRTFSLIKGRFWWSVLIAFVASMLIGVVTQILSTVVQFGGLIILALLPSASEAATVVFVWGSTLASYLVVAVLDACYLGATFTFVYIDLRIRHEGFDADLAEAAEARAKQ